MDGLSLQDQDRIWYQSPLQYSVASVLAQVQQGPYNCGYDISFNAVMRLGPGQFSALPYEVKYSSTDATFYIDKCYNDPENPTILADGECKDGSVPYEFSRDITIIAVLEDGTGQVASNDLNFRVTILDACLYDTISFDTNLSEINYAISTSNTPYTP